MRRRSSGSLVSTLWPRWRAQSTTEASTTSVVPETPQSCPTARAAWSSKGTTSTRGSRAVARGGPGGARPAPYLGHHPGRDGKAVAPLVGPGHEGDDRPLVALEGDEGPGVKGGAAHPPRISSAAARSASVRGPPEAASISSSRTARSSSFTFSSRAAAT